jgi:hypothetical protein
MPPVGFEPEIRASERPQAHVLDLAATGIGIITFSEQKLTSSIAIKVKLSLYLPGQAPRVPGG